MIPEKPSSLGLAQNKPRDGSKGLTRSDASVIQPRPI
jgi:hypothetical protein